MTPIPSWQRWPPNCCETCIGWQQKDEFTGKCHKSNSLDFGEVTDARYRCPAFERQQEKTDGHGDPTEETKD